jgi:hypothetical protein
VVGLLLQRKEQNTKGFFLAFSFRLEVPVSPIPVRPKSPETPIEEGYFYCPEGFY